MLLKYSKQIDFIQRVVKSVSVCALLQLGYFQKLTEHRKGSMGFSKSPPPPGRVFLPLQYHVDFEITVC